MGSLIWRIFIVDVDAENDIVTNGSWTGGCCIVINSIGDLLYSAN
jgi:hypothetical protein